MQQLLEQQQAAFAAKASGAMAPAVVQPAPKWQRVTAEVAAQLAVEAPLPHYSVGRQCGSLFGSSSAGGAGILGCSSRAHRPFASQLLAPAAVLEPPEAAALAANCGLQADLRWQLLPGGPGRGADAPAPSSTAALSASGQPPEASDPGSRYFGALAPGSGGSAPAASEAALWKRQYEQLLAEHPEDEQAWLSYAVRHAVEDSRAGSGGALSPGGPRWCMWRAFRKCRTCLCCMLAFASNTCDVQCALP